jgi:hypothetical protein
MSDIVNPARNSDIARRAMEAVDEAMGPVALYGLASPDGGFAPIYEASVEALVERARTANPQLPQGVALIRVQESLMRTVRSQITRLGSVSLDFDGVAHPRTFAVYDEVGGYAVPQIVFGALPENASLYREGVCEAIAVYYLPPDEGRPVVNKVTGAEEVWTNDFYASGYLGIVRKFATVADAEDARVSLGRAISAIGRQASAYEPFGDDADDTPTGAIYI